MTAGSFLFFLGLSLVFEVILIISTIARARRKIQNAYNPDEVTVQATRTYHEVNSIPDEQGHTYCEYRWEYNGKTHKTRLTDVTYDTVTITLNRRTGRLMASAKSKATLGIILAYVLVPMALSLIITTIVFGLKIL